MTFIWIIQRMEDGNWVPVSATMNKKRANKIKGFQERLMIKRGYTKKHVQLTFCLYDEEE